MKLNLRVTPATIDLIKRYEGLRERAARRSDGVWVIGYGHTRYAREGAQVTEKDAEALLLYDLMQISSALEKVIETPLNPHQFDALAAFAFDVGIEDFRQSDVLKWVREGALLQAASAIEAWRPPNDGRDRPSLDEIIRRRAEEKALFLRPTGASTVPAFAAPPPRPVQTTTAAPEMPVVRPAPASPPAPSVSPAPVPQQPASAMTAPVAPPQPVIAPPPPAVTPVAVSPHPVSVSAPPNERPEQIGLPQPLRPVAPAAEPVVRRASPPAPSDWAALVNSELMRPSDETPSRVPEARPAAAPAPQAPPSMAPSAAVVDVSHYDALLQALEATGPEMKAHAAPLSAPEHHVLAPSQTPLQSPEMGAGLQVASVEAPLPAPPVLTVTQAPDAITPEVVAPVMDAHITVEAPAGGTTTVESAGAPGPTVAPEAPEKVDTSSLSEVVRTTTTTLPPPAHANAVYVLGAAPANDHSSVPLETATVKELSGSSPSIAQPAEATTPTLSSEGEDLSSVRDGPSAPPEGRLAPPPLKRWTPPPRPPRPDRTVTTAVVIDALTPTASLPASAPPAATLLQPSVPTSDTPAVASVIAPVDDRPVTPLLAAEQAQSATGPTLALASSDDAHPTAEGHDVVEAAPEDVAPMAGIAPAEIEQAAEPAPSREKTPRRAFFKPATDAPPPKPREPVKLRLGALPYVLLGLLGVMLFAGALVSMFRQANIANLLAGLAGVAFMAPSAGHFLLALVSGQKPPPSQTV